MNFTQDEARGIRPLVADSPPMGWMDPFLSVRQFSGGHGVAEAGAGASSGLGLGLTRPLFEHGYTKGVEPPNPFGERKCAHLVNGSRPREKAGSACASSARDQNLMSMSSTDKGLLTPGNCAVIFIDHQPQMFFGVANTDRQHLLNNVLLLAKAARTFRVPVILTAVESRGFSGNITPQLLDLFPELTPIERSSMNAWDDKQFVPAVKQTGRKNLVMAALWSEVCLAMPALQALTDGFAVYAVEDASGGTSAVAHAAAIRRIEQAGGVSVTALQVLLEFQRDWARKEHYDEVMEIVRDHCGAYGQGVEYAATMVHKVPASRRHSQTT